MIVETKRKILAVDCLVAMKEFKTFRTLSRELGLPAGVLNRYVNGYVLPKGQRAERIIDIFSRHYMQKMMQERLQKKSKYIVTADLLSKPFLLKIIASKVAGFFPGKVDKVFTAASDGIPLAVEIAGMIGAGCIYAKKTREFAYSDHYASKGHVSEKPIESPFYLPKSLLKRNDSVLIVDDVIRGGETFYSLLSIVEEARANLAGIFAIFITSTALRKLRKKCRVRYLFLVNG